MQSTFTFFSICVFRFVYIYIYIYIIQTWTAEQLVNRGSDSKQEKQGGYAARMLANTRPKTALPYSLTQQGGRRRAPGEFTANVFFIIMNI